MNQDGFINAIKKSFKNIDKDFFHQVENYKNFLLEENRKFNLTSFDEQQIYSHYFYESIIPYRMVDFLSINTVLDIGSGSGIPGVVLKLLYPHLKVTLMESSQKKCKFLSALINHLKLTNINVINKRAENIDNDAYEKFDLVTSRAVSSLKILLEISAPYTKVGGLIIEPKSQKYQSEFNESKSIIKNLSLDNFQNDEFTSINQIFHHVFYFQKTKKTNHVYPRSWKTIIK